MNPSPDRFSFLGSWWWEVSLRPGAPRGRPRGAFGGSDGDDVYRPPSTGRSLARDSGRIRRRHQPNSRLLPYRSSRSTVLLHDTAASSLPRSGCLRVGFLAVPCVRRSPRNGPLRVARNPSSVRSPPLRPSDRSRSVFDGLCGLGFTGRGGGSGGRQGERAFVPLPTPRLRPSSLADLGERRVGASGPRRDGGDGVDDRELRGDGVGSGPRRRRVFSHAGIALRGRPAGSAHRRSATVVGTGGRRCGDPPGRTGTRGSR